MAGHECEKWQLREHPKGGMYCAACGMNQGDDPHADEFTERTDAKVLREVLAWAEEQHPWIGLMDLKEHIEERANEIEGKS